MKNLLLLPAFFLFSSPAIASYTLSDMYQYGNSWGGMSAACMAYRTLGLPENKARMLFETFYNSARDERGIQDKKLYKEFLHRLSFSDFKEFIPNY